MEQRSLKGNFVYSLLLSTFSLLYPVITSSIIINAIGPDYNGIIVSMTAFSELFVVLSIFGTDRYGQREIPLVKHDQVTLSRLFSELILIKFCASLLMFTFMIVYISASGISQNEKTILMIFSINIVGSIFSMDWFYQGIERFKFITLRVVGFRIVSLILIILYVNEPGNFIIYAVILMLTTNLNNITNFIYSRKFVKLRFAGLNIKRHFKTLSLFCLFATLVFFTSAFDLWYLGQHDPTQTTYLQKARQINLVAFALANSIAVVVIPRASLYFKTNKRLYKRLVRKSYNFTIMFALLMAVLIMIFSKNIMFIIGSYDIINASKVLLLTAPVIILYLINKWLQFQLLVPIGKERILLIITAISAFLSIVLNLIFVPIFGQNAYMGSAIIMLFVEVVTFAVSLYLIEKKANIKIKSLKLVNGHVLRCVVAAVAMLLSLLVVIGLYNLVWVNLMGNNAIITSKENTNIFYNILYCLGFGAIGTGVFGLVLIKLNDTFAFEVIDFAKQKLGLSQSKKTRRR